MGLGPAIVGAISDGLANQVGKESLQFGLAAMAVPQLLAAYCNWRATKTLRDDLVD